MSETTKQAVNQKPPVKDISPDTANGIPIGGSVDSGPMPAGLVDAPPVDSAIRQQATAWMDKGLIGRSVVDRNRADGYVRATAFALAPTLTPPPPTPAVTPAPDSSQFRYWHCDDLLDSAAALIDRFLAIQVEWRDKLARSFQVESEINEFLLCEKIYAEEVARGLYEVPMIEARQTALGDKDDSADSDRALSTAQSIYMTTYSGTNMLRQKGIGQFTAWLNAVPWSNAQYNETTKPYRVDFTNDGTSMAGNKGDILNDLGAEAADFQINLAETMAQLDLQRQRASANAVRARAVGTQRRSDWESLNADFRRRRMDAQRAAAEAKVGAFTTPGGALNYHEQMATLGARMARDAGDALDRLTAAAQGLKEIYGRDIALPAAVSAAITSRQAGHAVVDEACTWTRNAIAWLAAFKQLDMNMVVPLSLRAHMTPDAWTAGKDKGQWAFAVQTGIFGSLTHVRLRGLRAYVYGVGSEAGFFYLAARVPQSGTVSHGTAAAPPPLDQKDVPLVYLSKTGARSNFADQEFCGLHSVYNASPIGTWAIGISLKSTQRVALSAVEDIELELAIAGRPAQTPGALALGLPEFPEVPST